MAVNRSRSTNQKGKSRRGFASMDPAKQRRIASFGGRRAHELGKAHQWDSRSAQIAGRIGGRRRQRAA